MFPVTRRDRPRITVIAGARPNFVKVGPVIQALEGRAEVRLVHTGQHWDPAMSASFFDELGLPKPDVHLEVGGGSHAEVTAAVLTAVEADLQAHRPDALVVVGDVTSTVAAALSAAKLHVPVAHLEAGLRSRDWQMAEEVNRVVTDRISRWLLTPSPDADDNLAAEGAPPEHVHRVGNVMIDTLLANRERARERGDALRAELDLPDRYGVVTLHRPSNVDRADDLRHMLGVLEEAARKLPLVFPIHPRTRARMADNGVPLPDAIRAIDPQPYLAFIGLLDGATAVLTDSGGIQEETSVLGVPCLTMRTSTERPITVKLGTNRLVGLEREAILNGVEDALATGRQPKDIPLWDGRAGERVADVLLADLATG